MKSLWLIKIAIGNSAGHRGVAASSSQSKDHHIQ